MGLPISVDIPEAGKRDVFDKVFDRFRAIDERFSPYKPNSEVSKFRAGRTSENKLSTELKKIIKGCRTAERQTGGYFSAWADGEFDPSGYVKGWAIAEAGKIIEKSGYKTFCISAGGDIFASSNTDKVWNIGIQDPQNRQKILNKLSIKNGAVATSGNYERRAHIINPLTKKPAEELLSVTIIGKDIITADILATACFAMGNAAAEFMMNQTGYEALIIPNRRSRGNNL